MGADEIPREILPSFEQGYAALRMMHPGRAPGGVCVVAGARDLVETLLGTTLPADGEAHVVVVLGAGELAVAVHRWATTCGETPDRVARAVAFAEQLAREPDADPRIVVPTPEGLHTVEMFPEADALEGTNAPGGVA